MRFRAWLVGLPVLLGPSSTAWAEPTVVAFQAFSGPTASDVQRAALRATSARPEVRVVSAEALLRVAREAQLDPASAEGFEAACEALRVAAVIRGNVRLERGRWTAKLDVLHRATGRIAHAFEVRAASLGGLDDAVAARAWSELGPALVAAPKPKRRRAVLILSATGEREALDLIDEALQRAPWLSARRLEREANGPDELSQVAQAEGVDGFLRIAVDRSGAEWTADVEVIGPDGRSQENVHGEARRARRLADALLEPISEALDKVFEPASPVREAGPREPEVASAAEDPVRLAEELPKEERGLAAVEVAASFRLLGRNLSYNDDIFQSLRPYDVAGAPTLRVDVGWYPGAHLASGALGWIGVEAQGDLVVGLTSRDPRGRRFETSAFGVLAAVRGRVPFAQPSTEGKRPHELGLSVGGGLDAFTFGEGPDGADPEVPDVEYAFVRVGVDGRAWLTHAISLRADLGYRFVLSAGELGDAAWFPEASVGGLDGRLRAGYVLLGELEVILEGEICRYFASFEPRPGDSPVAGGAVDQRWSLAVGLGYRFR